MLVGPHMAVHEKRCQGGNSQAKEMSHLESDSHQPGGGALQLQ